MKGSASAKRKLIGTALLLPAVIYMIVFCIYPIVFNLVLSFQNVTMRNLRAHGYGFAGLSQYVDLFDTGKDPLFVMGILHTFTYTIFSILFQFTIGFAFAMLFARKFAFAKFLRGILLVAWLLPSTVIGLLVKYMFSSQGGVVNEVLLRLGLIREAIPFLVEKSTAMWVLIAANTWIGVPFNMILLATGLSTVPASLYESADIDGASGVQKFFGITVPMIKPAIMSVITLGFIYTFKVFDLVYVTTGGGPVNETEVLSTLSYRYSFTIGNFSKGAASANVLFLILLAASLLYLRLMRPEEEVIS
jgi:multiple sugar transport system permease protein